MPVRRDRRRSGADAEDTRRGGLGVGTAVPPPDIKDIDAWLRVNGVDVANSDSIQSLTDLDEREAMSFSHVLELQAGDYIELMFQVNDLNVMLNSFVATGTTPVVPSVTINVTQVR
ncbi:hypothetical protein KAR91_21335 [Candidatus Pacearchaeota archaeon]|nr:hypothetical protein [Candidatus Pacearchaeota archaeon]